MPIISRSFDDILIDRMKTALEAFSTAQAAMTASAAFKVFRDRVRPLSARDLPAVNIWLDRIAPEGRASTGRLYAHEIAKINFDCMAKSTDLNGDGLNDETAMARLYYLKEQVRYALYKLINADFGFSPGIIAAKRWPTYQVFKNELQLPESEVIAGRWEMEIESSWSPEDIEGVALDEIAVDADLWAASYFYD